jgi:outer membrane protein OmpA-like peptidoglycan-associated protein
MAGNTGEAAVHRRTRSSSRSRLGTARARARGVAPLATAAFAGAIGTLATLATFVAPRTAAAQQQTFHLDRLEVPGAPDDGIILFRAAAQPKPTFYAQFGLGYSADPLRTSDITNNPQARAASPTNIITTQISTYISLGVELFEHLTLGGTFPAAWIQTGNQPNYALGGNPFGGGASPTAFSTTGPAVGDTRLDARYVIARGTDGAFGVQLSVFVPTGAGSSTNFGGDGPQLEPMLLITGEHTVRVLHLPITIIGNLAYVIRHDNSINDPVGHFGPPDGIGVGNELRLAIGALVPLFQDRFRIGLTVMAQTGLQPDDDIIGHTFLTTQNTPVEWQAEGRMRLPKVAFLDPWFVGAGVGTRLTDGYGGPDFRLIGLVGMYLPIVDTNPKSPDRTKVRVSIHESMKDTDGDGIPDDIDACPDVPEDHKDPDPNDGCPAPADRDGDGIPDQYDKCPDQPEDKDGIDDQDGCPEDDADNDGVPDAKDACPKEPGQPDPDPKKNGCPKFIHLEGSQVRVLQQVHFQTGSATILPDSFPMLQEIVLLLKANPDIKHMRIEGHTDNRGNAAMNLDLSKRRAASVRQWLVDHGIDTGRLESEGYGLTRPIASNDTDEGRSLNRRVEFKILEQGNEGAPPAGGGTP